MHESAVQEKGRILIVEDHEGLRHSMKRWLGTVFPACEVIDLQTGEEAIALCGELNPGLILMDIKLPGMNGLEATRELKGINPLTKIIILTIYDTNGFRKSALEAGADAFISKNHMGRDLIPAVKEALCPSAADSD
ncbi:MAG: response regulator transcription factor [Nitrospirota bacterium]